MKTFLGEHRCLHEKTDERFPILFSAFQVASHIQQRQTCRPSSRKRRSQQNRGESTSKTAMSRVLLPAPGNLVKVIREVWF